MIGTINSSIHATLQISCPANHIPNVPNQVDSVYLQPVSLQDFYLQNQITTLGNSKGYQIYLPGLHFQHACLTVLVLSCIAGLFCSIQWFCLAKDLLLV